MVDCNIRKAISPLIGVLRASPKRPQPFSSTQCLRYYPTHLQRFPVRYYASPPTDDPRAPHPASPPQLPNQGPPNSQLEQQPSSQLPRYFSSSDEQQQYAPPPPPRHKRSIRPYIYATAFFLIGGLAGTYIRLIVAPPAPPVPSSPEDVSLTASIHALAAQLPLVRALNADPTWHSWPAYSSPRPDSSAQLWEKGARRLTSGPLGGAGGVGGYQRIWHDPSSGLFINVVWLGSALAGWPGVVHGGAIATLLEESMARCEMARLEVLEEGKEGPPSFPTCSWMRVSYRKPVTTNQFYVIRSRYVEDSPDAPEELRGGIVTAFVVGMDDKTYVAATGKFGPVEGEELKAAMKLGEGF